MYSNDEQMMPILGSNFRTIIEAIKKWDSEARKQHDNQYSDISDHIIVRIILWIAKIIKRLAKHKLFINATAKN